MPRGTKRHGRAESSGDCFVVVVVVVVVGDSVCLSLFFSFLSLSSSSRFAPLLSRHHPRVTTSLILFTYRVLLATST